MRAIVLCLFLAGCQFIEELSTPAPEPVTHTVQRGDTLWAISKQYGVSIDEIKAANGLSGDNIEIDQILVIPNQFTEPTTADTRTASRPPRQNSGSSGSSAGSGSRASSGGGGGGGSASVGLSMPPEQACLAGPTDVDVDGDGPAMAASVGLSHGQVKGAMDAFVGNLGRCVEGAWPVGEARLEITVACTGRVSQVVVLDGGGLAPDLLQCVQQTLRYAPFPAHDLPDGATIVYPLRFSGP